MSTRILFLGLATFVACAREPSAGAKLLNSSPDDKARVQEILRQKGIDGEVAALLTVDDHWLATVEAPPVVDGEKTTIAMPTPYRVFKDGRVEKGGATPQTKKR